MASIFCTCGLGIPTRSSLMSQPIHHLSKSNNITILSPLKLSTSSLTFGIKGLLRRPIVREQFVTYASNSDTQPGDSGGEKSDKSDGPPLLTIVAGLLVLLVVFWILGSIVTWLFSLIGNLASRN